MTRSTTLRGNQLHAALQERILLKKHIHIFEIENVDMPLKNITNDKH